MAKRLYVGNLPYTTSEPQLREMFSQAGEVLEVMVVVGTSVFSMVTLAQLCPELPSPVITTDQVCDVSGGVSV